MQSTTHNDTFSHESRVADLAGLVAERLGLTMMEIANVRMAALHHDIGKDMIPVEILDKPGRLTKEEFEIIKQHPLIGYQLLKDLEPENTLLHVVALQHHERCDGSGYPYGLTGDKLLLESRIVAICDVYEALRHVRTYKPPHTHTTALSILLENPAHYDPVVLKTFLSIPESDLEEIIKRDYQN